ncbi:MAG: GNAT family N-acetyltransferase [Thermogutta sp.]|uniref:GNAT family N-acetyltransferase n=1 Tax=Thermogutta sp. TaxID=1962930 RepID=UPI0019929F1A|nr:GNAT family N-acetyltransferase [Thermogutta sp.]MBC7352085.1 GNAT family N-acetyltransferase [Thermogutta sp.]
MVDQHEWSVRIHEDFRELEQLKGQWNRWAEDQPFRRYEWQRTWWEVYGSASRSRKRPRLRVLEVRHGGELAGIVPLYCQWHPLWGWVLRWLGSGEVCSDYLGPIAPACYQESVGRVTLIALHAMATGKSHFQDVSVDRSGTQRVGFHRIDWDGMKADDPALHAVRTQAEALKWALDIRPTESAWQIPLPRTWEEYLASLQPRSVRRRYRRLSRAYLDHPDLVLHVVGNQEVIGTPCDDNWQSAWNILVQLHQARRNQLGDQGRFASAPFEIFHRRILAEYLPAGRAALAWLEWQGQPVAAEYLLISGRTLMAYQSGVNPDFLTLSPGHIMSLSLIRKAIHRGFETFDFLRGDEPYKRHFGAKPTPLVRIRAAPPQVNARWRFTLWNWGRRSREFLRGMKVARSAFAGTATAEDLPAAVES